MEKYDAIIIGFGKGGKTLAVEMAKRNMNVAVVEKSDQMYGGTCINIGCIPTKVLVHHAKTVSQRPGLSQEQKTALYRRAIGKKKEITSLLRDKNYHNLADHPHITVYTGTGSFVSRDTVKVETGQGDILLTASRIFINTGAETVLPDIEGIAESRRVYTSTSVMELEELPRRLVIIGGGYIGLEFGSIYASFGSRVTILEGFGELIPREDRDIAQHVKEAMEKKGIRFGMNARVMAVKDTEKGITVTYRDTKEEKEYTLEAEAVLLAAGRKPNITGLNLEAAGVRTERGAIAVDGHLNTSNPAIRALGDVKGGLQFTYISLDDYRIVREDIFGNGNRHTGDREPVPYSVFIDPPLSRIGLGEDQARKQNLDILVKKLPVSAIPRAKTVGETEGLLKAVIEKNTGKILGCTLFCADSHEVINLVALAMKAGLDAAFLRDFIYTHPSMSESMNELFS